MPDGVEVYTHERVITGTLLSVIFALLFLCAYTLFETGLAHPGEQILFATIVFLNVLILLFGFVCLRKRIVIDFGKRQIVLAYVRYPEHFFDVLPRRRVHVPFGQLVTIRAGLMCSGGRHLSWHVYTRESRFEFTAYMKDEKRLRRMFSEIALANRIPDEECRYLRSGISFDRVLWISCAIVFFTATVCSILIIYVI